MGEDIKSINSKGFTAIEGALIVVVIVAVIGVGSYIINHDKTVNKVNTVATKNASSVSSSSNIPSNGTTSSISQLTQNDAQSENSVDNSFDTQVQSNLNSANISTNAVGGSYNASNL